MQRIALLSVFHKDGIVSFARELCHLGFLIYASGGTAKALDEAAVPVCDIGSLVGEPILNHRVVTLSRELHAGLLATPEDDEELTRLKIRRIDLVCVDFYPLREEISRPGATTESVIEKTDIGGPALLRSAAKGRRIAVCDQDDRTLVIKWLKNGRPDEQAFLTRLAAKAEAVVANYALDSARCHSAGEIDGMIGRRIIECRYGENPSQKPAGLYRTSFEDPLALHRFTKVEGGDPSFINLTDLDRLLTTANRIAAAFDVNNTLVPHIAVGGKHGNACGASVSGTRTRAIEKMVRGDMRAIFGGVVLTNFRLDEKAANTLSRYGMEGDTRRILDGVIAPSINNEAIGELSRKDGGCRMLTNSVLAELSRRTLDTAPIMRPVRGGFLLQPNYAFILDLKDERLERLGALTTAQEEDLLLAWAVGSTSNSNTVTLVKNGMLIGNGVGRQDRVGACELAIKRARDAGHDTKGAIAYSDSFFPFLDGPLVLADAGISAIFASSGSVKDAEVKKTCEARGVTLWLIPDAVGRGFFGH